MAETNLKRGDVVRLKSGSCPMTVKEITTTTINHLWNRIYLSDNHITVEWFFEGKIMSETFYESQLIQIKATE